MPSTTIVIPPILAWMVFIAPAAKGGRLAEYNQAIREATAAGGGTLADLAALDEEYESMDGIHPSGAGMRQVAGMWLRCLDAAP